MSKTTKIILWAVCIAVCIAAIVTGTVFAADSAFGIITHGDGNVITKEYAYDGNEFVIRRISVSNLTPTVAFVKADTAKVTVTADSNIAELISVNDRGEEIEIKGALFSIYTATKCEITIYYTNIEDITLSGKLNTNLDGMTSSVDVKVSGSGEVSAINCATSELSFDVSGSSKINVCGTIGELDISASGSCDVTLCGTIGTLDLELSGSGKYEGSALICNRVEIECSGSSKVTLSGTSDSLAVNTSGSINIDTSTLICRAVTLRCSGSCVAKVYADEILNINSTGSCDIVYYGNATPNQDSSGSGSIRRG